MSDASAGMDDWLQAHPGLWQQWLISPRAKAQIRTRLDQANVTERVLIPGLDGLAAWLRRHYGPRENRRDSQHDGAAVAGVPTSDPGGQGEPE
jgi:hypothetical protein